MASGSQNMTTYNARTVTGSNSAASPAGALLLSGAGRADNATGDTWIFLDSAGGTSTPWGIKHDQANNKIQIFGAGTNSVWAQMNTGDTYILGKVGIGYDPETNGNTYKLYVNGSTASGSLFPLSTLGYNLGSSNLIWNDAHIRGIATRHIDAADEAYIADGQLHIGYGSVAPTKAIYLYYSASTSSRTKFFEVNSNGAYAVTRFGVNGQDTGYNLYVNGSSYFTDHMYIGRSNSAHIYLINKNWTKGTNPSSQTYSAVEYNDVNNSRIALLEATLDTSGNSQFNIFLVPNVASSTSWSGIILQKTNANVLTVNIAGTTTVSGTVHANGGYLKSTVNNNTLTIGSQNTSFCHFDSSANIPFWFNNTIQMAQGKIIGGAGTQYRPFQLYLGRYTTSGTNALDAGNPLIEFSNSDRSQYCQLIYDDWDSLCAPDSLTLVGNQNGINFICKNGPIWIQGGSNAGGNVNRLTTSSGMPGNMQYNTSRRGTQIYSNGIAFADPYNGNSNNDAGWIRHIETSANNGILEIAVGDDGAEEIIARQYNTSNNVARQMYLLNGSGFTSVSNQSTDSSYMHAAMQIRETNFTGAGSDTWGQAPRLAWHWGGRVTAQIGLASNGWLYEAPNGTTFYRMVCETGTWGINITGSAGSCTGNAATASTANFLNMNNRAPIKGNNQLEYLQFSGSTGTGFANYNPTNDWYSHIRMNHGNTNGYFIDLAFCFHAQNNYVRRMVNGSDQGWKRLWTEGNSVTSAVWNDYAEARAASGQPGQIVYELGDDTCIPTTERLQHFAGIISDTWGFSQGETDSAKTHIAVAGRVLAYPYHDRNEYKPGDVLCAAPGGTVDIMTREEIIQYPDRIVGTVSCVPDYEEWGGGEGADRPPVKVNGRIWVKVR